MLWRRPGPTIELPLDRDEVIEIFAALSDLKAWTLDILAILEEEIDDEP